MTYKIIIVALLSVFLFSIGYGTENIYTWKDEQGVLHITDNRPPYGAEIIDVSPSYRKAAEEIQAQRLIRQKSLFQKQERQRMREEAVQARRVEAEALQLAEESLQQAESLRQVKGKLEKKRRYYRKAERYEKKAEEALKKAEAAGKKAEMLEKRLSE